MDNENVLPIGYKHGCYTVIAGFDAYQEECIKDRIAKIEAKKRKFINGEDNSNFVFPDIESCDGYIENLKNAKQYKVQCKCGKTDFMPDAVLLKKRWRYCGDDCGRKQQHEAKRIASYPRVESSDYNIKFVNNIHESLDIVACIDDHVEREIYTDTRRKTVGTVYLHKKFHCKCYLCGKEYDFLSNQFAIRNDSYGPRAKWGYYCEAFCDCHPISSFQWRTIDILHENKIPYKVEVSFPDLLSEKGFPLRFDFAIYNSDGSIKYLIECQGRQHYEIGNGFGGHGSLKKRQEKDAQKREFAKKKGIQLIEIPYKIDTYEKEVTYLQKYGVI